jgi:hypothetical protein
MLVFSFPFTHLPAGTTPSRHGHSSTTPTQQQTHTAAPHQAGTTPAPHQAASTPQIPLLFAF